jgi:DNA invertase Pin-like site-specific DNA recombinase
MSRPVSRPASDAARYCVSYTRWSTASQTEGDSLRRQLAITEKWAADNGYTQLNLTFRDEGRSGYSGSNRKGDLGKLIDAIKDGTIPQGTVVVVELLDRLTRRDPLRALDLVREVVHAGCPVMCVNEGLLIDRDLLYRDSLRLMVVFMSTVRGHEESLRKSGRLRQAWGAKKARAAETGELLTTQVPGWLIVTKDRKLKVNAERAKIVKHIIALALEGRGIETIARTLNEARIPAFKGGIWGRSSLVRLLANPALYGAYQPHQTVEDEDGNRSRKPAGKLVANFFPALIDKATFTRLQRIRLKAGARSSRIAAPLRNAFTGLARCSRCGASMSWVQKGERSQPQLVCVTARLKGKCAYRSVRYTLIESAFLQNLPRLLAEAPLFVPSVQAKVQQLDAQLEILTHEIGNLVEAIAASPSAALSARLRELELSKARTEAEHRELLAASGPQEARASKAPLAWLQSFAEGQPETIEEPAPFNAKLRQLSQSIVLDPTSGYATVNWYGGTASSFVFAMPPARR